MGKGDQRGLPGELGHDERPRTRRQKRRLHRQRVRPENHRLQTSNYDKKIAREKTFRTKDFAGAGEYKHNDYQFLKRQDYQAKTVRDQNQLYAEGSSEAPEEKRRFFWQRKKARTKAFNESDKLARTGNYRDAEASLKRLENRDLTIVDDRAKADGASLTLGDVRTLLHGSDE